MKNKKGIHAIQTQTGAKVHVTQRDIDNIMVTALEGGITDWCGGVEVNGECLGKRASDQISRGGTLTLYDIESSDKWNLTLDKILNGIKLAIEANPRMEADLASKCMAVGDVDALAADEIVQYALFGELVFA